MKMKQKRHLINKKVSLLFLLTFFMVSCGKGEKQLDVGNSIANENKANDMEKITDEDLGIKERPKDNADKKSTEQIDNSKKEVFKISEHLEEINSTLKNLHHFTNNRSSILETNIDGLKKLNCEIKTNLNQSIYQERDSVVMASIVKNSEMKKIDEYTYQFYFTIACGESATNGLNRKQVGLNLIDYLKDDKYNKTISYTLKINEDDTKGEITLNDINWYAK